MQLHVKKVKQSSLLAKIKNKKIKMSPPKNDLQLMENLSYLLQLIPNSFCNSISCAGKKRA